MKGGKRDVFVLQFTDGQALTGLGIFPLRMEDPAEDNSSHHAPQTSMQWRKLRAGCLHYSRRIAVSGGFLNATAIHVRNVYTIGPDEEIAPWNTSWSEHDDQREENSTPPYSRDISLAVASNAKERGVLIDERGQLKVTSQARAERDCRTVLVLSAASTSLTEADFTRLLPESERSEGRGIDGASYPP